MPLGRQGPLAKAFTAGIGLTQEFRADRKSHKESGTEVSSFIDGSAHQQSTHPHDETSSEDDERWAQDLDAVEAEYTLAQPDSESNPEETVDDVVRNFLASQGPLSNMDKESLLQPIILPQRRPGVRSRGWVRGYAPVLAARGIDQNVWLDFLAGFEKAIGKNRWFHVLNLAAWVADKIHLALAGISLIAKAVSAFIHISLEMTRRGYIHSKQNRYLDKLNDEYFKPRGLYALVVKYQPKSQSSNSLSFFTGGDVPVPIETVDINTHTVEAIERRMDDEGKFWKGLMKGSASKVTHEEEIPDFAPLIFPYLDELPETEKTSAVKRNGAFLADYYDRRAQAKFTLDNPDSKLADVAPRKEFASGYADPSDPKSQRDLFGMVSGGTFESPSRMLMKRTKQRRGRLGIGGDKSVLERVRGKKDQRKNKRPIKKLMRQDALYLMVVDLPSQEEQEAVRKAIETLADG